jgi:hypothetical protein
MASLHSRTLLLDVDVEAILVQINHLKTLFVVGRVMKWILISCETFRICPCELTIYLG